MTVKIMKRESEKCLLVMATGTGENTNSGIDSRCDDAQ